MDHEEADKRIFTVPMREMPEIKGLGQTLFQKMLDYKDRVAHTHALTGETETYDVVLQKTIRTVIAMRLEGIQPNDIITICSHCTLECNIPYYASYFIGAVSANLDPLLPLSDTIYLLQLVCPKIIFVIPEAVELIENALKELKLNTKIVVFGETSKYVEFSKFLELFPEEETNFRPYEVKDVKDTAVIVFSSGTTGLPKGICLTHYALLGIIYQRGPPPPSSMTLLTFSNLYWIAGVVASIHCIVQGFNRLIYPRFKEGKSIWDVLTKCQVNIVSLNPYQAMELCKDGRPETADTSSVFYVVIPGGPVTGEQINHFRKCFNFPRTIVANTYGQTEMNSNTLAFQLQQNPDHMKFLIEKPESVGCPLPGFSYKIVDIETEEILGPNQEGELLIKSDFAMRGYYKKDSSSVWDKDGFMRTGDVAYYDEDKCFFIVDRVKDVLKYKMWHICPAKIEGVFYTHPAIKVCVVTGLSHPVDGDHLLGVVELRKSAIGKVTEEELLEYVNNKVGDQFKLRAGVKFVEKIPLTVSDKTSRMKIRQLVAKGEI